MIINSIKQISASRYNVVIDNNKYTLYDDTLIEFNILKTKEITNEEFEKIINKNNYYDSYNKILKYISFKLRTEKEIIDKLYSYKINKDIIYTIIDKLKSNGLINNEKYLNSFINDELNLTLNGPKKIEKKLLLLGFNKNEFINLINNIEDSVWTERCNRLIEKKQKEKIKTSFKNTIQKYKVYLNNNGYDEKYYHQTLSNITIDDELSLKKDYLKLYNKYKNKYSNNELKYIIKQKLYAKGYTSEQIDIINVN